MPLNHSYGAPSHTVYGQTRNTQTIWHSRQEETITMLLLPDDEDERLEVIMSVMDFNLDQDKDAALIVNLKRM